MLCERGGQADVVKVLDFGLVTEVTRSSSSKTGSEARAEAGETGSVVGTPLYLSPEALTSPDQLDARSDLYAVGVAGYFLLTGSTPFTGSLIEVCGHHLHTTPEPVSQRRGRPIPAELEGLIMSCLSKAAGERPESAAVVERALLELGAKWSQDQARHWWSKAKSFSEPLRRAELASASGSRVAWRQGPAVAA
jgi:serine/threonine-protein kinase